MDDNIILMKDIYKSYKMGKQTLPVLNGISIKIKRGEFVAILGPSGSGKSTLMNIIGCIDVADSGEYILAGKNINSRNEDELAFIRNREIGFVFQKFNLLPKFTAVQNVELPLLLRGVKRTDAHERALKILEGVGLSDRANHKPIELSGGQQQRVSIARALIGEPDILLADEPTGNLDSKSSKEIIDLFIKLNNEGHTIILITHDLNVASKAKKVLHIMDGQIYS
ncbi:putative ABC transport system ATP-binding protein [Caloramator quimbayensis]|uniref:Putative ABC transport system ATP-binding protein n=1 Tax=Caloramator quimbayensis TaxID=1147123 RepID=A0A1T4YBC2_9CLOT|nr:ABC transporter ATP-binding protein [Caloramator quimbayensis]SKA98973.1 putative ABC transport system ATP-binding protein [Caloramator quimbayensis]